MKRVLVAMLVTFSLVPWFGAAALAKEEPVWEPVLQNVMGLDLAHIESEGITIHALRIDPEKYEFSLYSAMWEGPPRTVGEWAREHNLLATINAGMYQADGLTSTGYLRDAGNINNGRVAGRYGGFFVAGPQKNGLPGARILDKNSDAWKDALQNYRLVAQNFRLIGPDKANLWPQSPEKHAVAALGEDTAGKIYFFLCPQVVTVHNFVEALLAQPENVLDLKAAIYVEGGVQAAMYVGGQKNITWMGSHPAALFFGQSMLEVPLPNVLGVSARP